MDKVQIYYLVSYVLNFLITLYSGILKPEDTINSRQRLLYYPLTLALGLPTIGRIFGWW